MENVKFEMEYTIRKGIEHFFSTYPSVVTLKSFTIFYGGVVVEYEEDNGLTNRASLSWSEIRESYHNYKELRASGIIS